MSGNRTVFHIDVNSAFLSWESVERLKNGDTLDLRTIPSAVGGDEDKRHGVVLAKSILAQKYGIKTGESLYSARQKCPDLVVVPSNFQLYTQCSRKLFNRLRDFSPLLEQFSIDECFLEYTGLEKLHGDAVSAAEKLKREIREEFGFTVNIGIGPNKILAKMAGELKKPDMVCTIFTDEIQQKLWPQPVRNLFMVGAKTESALALHAIKTIGDLAQADPEMLCKLLKSHGMRLWHYANGVDNTPVTEVPIVENKSISNSTTLSSDISSPTDAYMVILKLCQSVCMRMRDEHYLCKTISVGIKYNTFETFSSQATLKEPTDNTNVIFGAFKDRFDALWNGDPVRLLSVGVSDLIESTDDQTTLFENISRNRHKKLDDVCDNIRKDYGNSAITFGTELIGDRFNTLDRFFPDQKKSK